MRNNAPTSTNGDNPVASSRFEAFIGPRWSTYRTKLRPFFEEPSFVPTWNWPAALFGPFWFLYRKLYLGFLLFWFAPGVALRMLAGERADVPLTPATELLPLAPWPRGARRSRTATAARCRIARTHSTRGRCESHDADRVARVRARRVDGSDGGRATGRTALTRTHHRSTMRTVVEVESVVPAAVTATVSRYVPGGTSGHVSAMERPGAPSGRP
jgi:hypothetical protein